MLGITKLLSQSLQLWLSVFLPLPGVLVSSSRDLQLWAQTSKQKLSQ